MSDGGAQFKTFGPFFSSSGAIYRGIKLNIYQVGTTSNKDYWTDEDKSTLGSYPLVDSDSDGIVGAFFDGDYRIQVKDSSGNALDDAIDWDSFKITSDMGTMWEGNNDTSYPSATSANKYHMAVKRTAGDVIQGVAINDGTAFREIAALMPDGSLVNTGYINVKHPDYGAVGDGSNDDTSAIQAAINAAKGTSQADPILTVYFPPGAYSVTSAITFHDCNLVGNGPDSSTRIIWDGSAGGTVFTKPTATWGGSSSGLVYGMTWKNGANEPATWLDLTANIVDKMFQIERMQFTGCSSDAIKIAGWV